jgi:hypothetical protein
MSERVYSDELRERAEMHRPKTLEDIELAARALAAQGYSPYTVAAILKMDVLVVREMLGGAQ